MAANKRYYKDARKQNNKAINEFLGEVVGAVRTGSLNAMQKIAARGLDVLVNKVAGFSDYTGLMINSYQAAIIDNGRSIYGGEIKEGAFQVGGHYMEGLLLGGDNKNVFRNGKKSIRLLTSKGIRGTTPISLKRPKKNNRNVNYAVYKKRKGRNPQSAPVVVSQFTQNLNIYQGFGRDLTGLKGLYQTGKGIQVIFRNPTPYALEVQYNNEGSDVMPGGLLGVPYVSITTQEIRKAVKNAKTRKKRR